MILQTRISAAILLHFLLLLASATCFGQNADSNFFNRKLDEVEVYDTVPEFNRELYNYMLNGGIARQDSTKFYSLEYQRISSAETITEGANGTFFLKFKYHKMLPLQSNGSSFITINYFPDATGRTISNHLDVVGIFDEDIFTDDYLLTEWLGHAKSKFIHTTKQKLNDSICVYNTVCYRYGDSASLITKVNTTNGKVLQTTVLNPFLAFKNFVRKDEYKSYIATYDFDENAMVDSVEVIYSFAKDEKLYQEHYKIKTMDYNANLLETFEYTKAKSLLIFRLRSIPIKFMNVIKGKME